MKYYYLKNNEAQGPFSLVDMLALAGNGTVSADTLVSREGDAEFRLALHLDELANAVRPGATAAGKAAAHAVPLPRGTQVGLAVLCLLLWPVALLLALGKLGADDKREAYFMLRWVAIAVVLTVVVWRM